MNELGYYFLPVIATKPQWRNVVPGILDQECDLVDLKNPDVLGVLTDVIFEMYRTLYATVGVGLAAPQVGIRWQLAVIDTQNPKDPGGGRLVLINPEIADTYDSGIAQGSESCLCVPFYRGDVPRYERIKLRNLTLAGEIEEMEVEGFFARVVQHEMDHLRGILYTDRLESPEALHAENGAHITSHAHRSMGKLKVKELVDKRMAELSSQLVEESSS